MTGKQKFWLSLAMAHLLIALLNAIAVPMNELAVPGVRQFLRWYGAVSGANNSFGFFKQVGCGLQAKFKWIDENEQIFTDTITMKGEGGEEEKAFIDNLLKNQEVQLRFNSNVNMVSTIGDQVMRQWAAAMFGRHPTAVAVEIEIEVMNPGTMEEYRNGNRPAWQTSFKKSFVRRDIIEKGV